MKRAAHNEFVHPAAAGWQNGSERQEQGLPVLWKLNHQEVS